jgi:hypothetical protein
MALVPKICGLLAARMEIQSCPKAAQHFLIRKQYLFQVSELPWLFDKNQTLII